MSFEWARWLLGVFGVSLILSSTYLALWGLHIGCTLDRRFRLRTLMSLWTLFLTAAGLCLIGLHVAVTALSWAQ